MAGLGAVGAAAQTLPEHDNAATAHDAMPTFLTVETREGRATLAGRRRLVDDFDEAVELADQIDGGQVFALEPIEAAPHAPVLAVDHVRIAGDPFRYPFTEPVPVQDDGQTPGALTVPQAPARHPGRAAGAPGLIADERPRLRDWVIAPVALAVLILGVPALVGWLTGGL